MYLFLLGLFSFCSLFQAQSVVAEWENVSGKGWLEVVEGQQVLHLKGSPYEIGYQHGDLLKSKIIENIERFIVPLFSSERKPPPVVAHFLTALPQVIPHIPAALRDEMQGIADAADISFSQILLLNVFPEMFHCTGITVSGDATADGELYHVRVLDYAAGNGLQNTAVLMVVEPDQGLPFMNVTYAGFIGCVTGMNASKIAIGEIGGKGYGHWAGIPMAFLLRDILQYATSLEAVQAKLEEASRTCEYYYVFSDGKTGQACAYYATSNILKPISPGEQYPKSLPVPNAFEGGSPAKSQPEPVCAAIYNQLKDTIMIVRDDHYDLLRERLAGNYGSIGIRELQESVYAPIAHQANLHNAIFAPATLDVWIAHAGIRNQPAYGEPYHHFNLTTLLGR